MNSKLIKACAGGGKTTLLIDQLVSIAETYSIRNQCWPRVVVTTFTNKATEELKERLLKKAIYEKTHLIDFVTSGRNLHISTLHGVLNLFLGKFGNHLFLESRGNHLESHVRGSTEDDNDQINPKINPKRSLRHLDAGFSFNFVSLFDQKIRFKSLLKDLLLEVKESSFLIKEFGFEKLFQMVRTWSRAFLENPFLIPHDKKSFLDLKRERLSECIRFLKDIQSHGDFVNHFLKELNFLKGSLNDEVLSQVLRRLMSERSFLKGLSKSEKKEALVFLKKITDVLRGKSFLEEYWKRYFHFFRVFEDLARKFHLKLMDYKKKNSFLEIEDLELLSWKLIREKPEIALEFSSEWNYWLIDEYQDTSSLQDKIFDALIGEKSSFIVGDIHQSIYLFRGASNEVWNKKEAQFLKKGGKVLIQNKNFRSSPELLCFLNDFFKNAKLAFVFKKMEAREEDFLPQKIVCYFSITDCVKKKKALTSLQLNEIKEKEYFRVLSHIQKLREKGEDYKDICILARTHFILSNLTAFLKKRGLPCASYGSLGFSERREILDAKALLKFLLNPHDNCNLIKLLRSPFFYIPDDLLSNQVYKVKASFWNELMKNKKSLEEKKVFNPVLRLKKYLDHLKQESILNVYEQALKESNFVKILSSIDPTGQSEANLWKWIIGLKREERTKGAKFLSYLMESSRSSKSHLDENDLNLNDLNSKSSALNLSASQKEITSPRESNAINLMTIHAAKGLSFKHILLVSLHLKEIKSAFNNNSLLFSIDSHSRWSFPLSLEDGGVRVLSLADEKHLKTQKKMEEQEFDRLLYVALTRAEESVFFSWIKPYHQSSWAYKIESAWNLDQGVHKREKYSYEVQRSS